MACKNPCPPSLQHRVDVNFEDDTPDAGGGDQIVFTFKYKMWTYFENITGSEKFAHQKLESRSTHKLTCRYMANLFTTDQIVFRGVQYDIHYIDNIDMMNQWNVVYMEAGGVQ